jgi:hypothetical protein
LTWLSCTAYLCNTSLLESGGGSVSVESFVGHNLSLEACARVVELPLM